MTLPEFQTHMGRLIEQFGKASYSQARVELIWGEVQNLDSFWWKITVNRFLGESRHAPLMPEIREAIAKERERMWEAQKDRSEAEAKQAMASIYGMEDLASICQGIMSRIKGNMPDQDFQSFTSMIKSAPPAPKGHLCKLCDGSGLVFARHTVEKTDYVFKCCCPIGKKDKRAYPSWNMNPQMEIA